MVSLRILSGSPFRNSLLWLYVSPFIPNSAPISILLSRIPPLCTLSFISSFLYSSSHSTSLWPAWAYCPARRLSFFRFQAKSSGEMNSLVCLEMHQPTIIDVTRKFAWIHQFNLLRTTWGWKGWMVRSCLNMTLILNESHWMTWKLNRFGQFLMMCFY